MRWNLRQRLWKWRICASLAVPPGVLTWIHTWSHGRLGGRIPLTGVGILYLTTTGRRSGKARTTPVLYFRDRDQLLIVASNRGSGKYPDWYWNLQFNPEATIQLGQAQLGVVASEARWEERNRLWALLVAKLPLLEDYQHRTPRQLPVILLRIAPCSASSAERCTSSAIVGHIGY